MDVIGNTIRIMKVGRALGIIEELLGPGMFSSSCMAPDLYEMMAKSAIWPLVKDPPKRMVEIGTYRGISSAVWCQLADSVTTIDVVKQRETTAVWEAVGCRNLTSLVIDTSAATKRAILNGMNFDCAFIDGDHENVDFTKKKGEHETGPALDFECVAKCGRVLFHDYGQPNPPGATVLERYIDTIPENYGGKVVVCPNFAWWFSEENLSKGGLI